MKKLFSLLLGAFLLLSGSAFSAGPTQKDATTMADKAVAYANANSKDKLIAEVNAKNPDFIQGELYVVVYGLDGMRLAHPLNAKLIGKSVLDIADVDGKEYGKEFVAIAKDKGKGWVDYKYRNPTSNKIEQKTAYIIRAGDIFIMAGIYK
jgi:cytochrome c